MMKTVKPAQSLYVLLFAVLLLISQGLLAAHHEGAANKLVIQVSTDDPQTQAIAMNNAVNVQKALGMDNVAVEIVAYGPGLSLMTDKSKHAQRVASLAMQDITFSACGNTMDKIEQKTGHKPVLIDGVKVVPAGVIRIMELQQQGYAYVRP